MNTRILLVTVLTGVLALIVGVELLVPGGWPSLPSIVAWFRELGALGYALYAIAVLVGIVAFIPVVWFAAGAGFLFGAWAAVAITWPAAILGAFAAFTLGRSILQAAVARQLARRPRLAAIDEALGEGGVRIILLLRLSAPHNILNYALSATRVSRRDFVIATAITTLPFCLVFAHGGALAGDLDQVQRVGERLGPWSSVILVLGVLAAAVAVLWIGRAARRALERRLRTPT